MKPHQQNFLFVLATTLFVPATATEPQASNVVGFPTRNVSGIATTFPGARIASRQLAPVSLMPPGLERSLYDRHLADLPGCFRNLRPISP